jgi:hypothetical protein
MVDMPACVDMYKQNFCRAEYKECARFIVAVKLGPDNIPNDLFPNQKERAKQLTA